MSKRCTLCQKRFQDNDVCYCGACGGQAKGAGKIRVSCLICGKSVLAPRMGGDVRFLCGKCVPTLPQSIHVAARRAVTAEKRLKTLTQVMNDSATLVGLADYFDATHPEQFHKALQSQKQNLDRARSRIDLLEDKINGQVAELTELQTQLEFKEDEVRRIQSLGAKNEDHFLERLRLKVTDKWGPQNGLVESAIQNLAEAIDSIEIWSNEVAKSRFEKVLDDLKEVHRRTAKD